MPSSNFRKLNVELPRQSTVDTTPWLVAGTLFMVLIMLLTGYAYFMAV